MKKVGKIIGIVLGVVLLVILGVMAYVKFALPNVGDAPTLTIERTPERIARGEYLANHVTVCMDCHSTRDYSLFSAPLEPGTLGKGGELFNQEMGFPGSFTSKNITPAGIGSWTDGEIYRAVTTGVSRDGHAFFPVMPYPYYGKMSDEDVKSIVAYVRSLKPIENKPADSRADFPFNFILNTIPQKAEPSPMPDPKDELATGKYLVMIAGCVECHTQVEKGQIIKEKSFSGGREFKLPGGTLVTANITPDKETGIGSWTKEAFVSRFRTYADSTYKPHKVGANDFQTIMPWTMYGGMNEQDLGAIYTYLMSLKPIPNKVEKFTPNVAQR
ncbi:c-type cytochrome [Spirosoma sp. BT702]|uniref:C-type cytochrome n=1 Tax=Spirosoma profusum TaxID=2771354 RepID=A0A927AU43_9BACT|nr:c-type cytochrome [Spirosoma profusum]MBD2702357.1 c-type cytochrome [Spirosoma profusum]